jgi:hypothetical protein
VIEQKTKKLKMIIQMDIPRKMLNEKPSVPVEQDLQVKKQGSAISMVG